MVSYENGVFMEMETYEMYTKPKNFNKSFENILKISPNFEQKIINFDKALEMIEQSARSLPITNSN